MIYCKKYIIIVINHCTNKGYCAALELTFCERMIHMKKKIISAALCLAMIASIFTSGFTAGAAETADSSGTKRTVDFAGDFTWDNANVYFLLTDRFCNGNPLNDHSYGRTLDRDNNPIPGWDTCPGTFHGGDFAGITQKINQNYFNDLGVNAIWISAPYEQIHGYTDSGKGFAHYGYHGYYALDYTETDANFGTKQEFKTLVDTAHSHGIRVVLDVVINHAGYNNLKDMMEYNYGTIKNSSAAEEYLYKINDVSGYSSYIEKTSASDWGRWWGTDWIRAGLPGYFEDNSSDLTKCLAGLPDFRTESTQNVSVPQFLRTKWQKEGTLNEKMAKYQGLGTVSDYLTTWISEWVENYGVDGFRCDTAKHVELATWKKLKNKCVAALKTWRQNNPDAEGADWDEDFWMTGESWGHTLTKDSYYNDGVFDSMINFSYSGRSIDGVGSLNSVYQTYANSINSDQNFNVLTYISSHDTNLARSSDLYYQGTSLLLLPGGVQTYYGDESNRGYVSNMAFDGDGGSGHCLRSDMNWSTTDQNVLTHWQKVGQFRSNHVAVGAGSHRQITPYNSSTGYTFAREYADDNVIDNVICTVGAPKNTNIQVDVSSLFQNGKTLTNEYDSTTAVVQNGKVTFNSGSQGVILISGPESTISMGLRGETTAFYDSQNLTLSLHGADYAMVSVNGNTPFRVVDGQTFAVGDGIEAGTTFNVVVTATNSTETVEKTFTYKKKDPDAVTKIYFDNSEYNWSTVNVYIYDETTSPIIKNAEWPGLEMDYDSETGYYVYEVDDELTENGLAIFNNGSAQYPAQNERGLEIDGTDKMLVNRTEWKEFTQPAARVLIGDVNLDGKVNILDTTAVQRHCASISALADSALTAADADRNYSVDITDATLIQKYAAHMTVSGNHCGEYMKPLVETRTIYLDNNYMNLSNPCIYVWKCGTEDCMVKWPGTQMKNEGNNMYSYTCPKDYNCCIFLDGTTKKTGDLTNIPYLHATYMGSSGWVNADEAVIGFY